MQNGTWGGKGEIALFGDIGVANGGWTLQSVRISGLVVEYMIVKKRYENDR